jgi:hypothetical protein
VQAHAAAGLGQVVDLYHTAEDGALEAVKGAYEQPPSPPSPSLVVSVPVGGG